MGQWKVIYKRYTRNLDYKLQPGRAANDNEKVQESYSH